MYFRFKFVVLSLFLLISTSAFNQGPDWLVFNTANSGLPGNNVASVEVDSSNNKWVGTIYNGVARFDNLNWTVYTKYNSGLYDHCVEHVFIDSLDQKWFTTCWSGRVSMFDNAGWFVYDSLKTNGAMNSYMKVTDFKYLNDKFYISTDNFGIIIYDGLAWVDSGPWNSNIPGFSIQDLETDAYGNLWLAQFIVGITKFDGVSWVNYNTQNSVLPSNDVTSIAFESNGIMWATTRYDGLVKFDGSNWTVYTTSNSGLPSNYLKKIVVDSANVKWLITLNTTPAFGSGLIRYDDVTWTLFDTSNSDLPSPELQSLTIDKFNNKWIGTSDSGLVVFRQGGVVLSDPSSDYSALQATLYPNPANLHCVVSLPTIAIQCQIEIFDLIGKLIFIETISNSSEIDLRVKDLQVGAYIVKVSSDKQSSQFKLIVQH